MVVEHSSVLAGDVAWVIGAGSGIGQASAISLAAAGARVFLSGRRAELLSETARAIGNAGGSAEVLVLDATDATAVEKAAGVLADSGAPATILVNTAGTNVRDRALSALTPTSWKNVLDVNLNAAFYTTAAVLPYMRRARRGIIINISSWAGRFPSQFTGAAYGASKSALLALTMAINMEEGRNNIRACALCPGEVATPILDTRAVPPSQLERSRMLQPADVGEVIRFVASLPQHVCMNEIVISPTWNSIFT